MLTVVCINWKNYLGRGLEYVGKLQRAVARNLTVPHQFVCLDEHELGTDLTGWWVKMKLAEPGRFTGDVLYLDLDVVITGSLDGMVALLEQDRKKLWARDDFSYSLRNPKIGIGPDTRRMLGGDGCFNSSIMLWHGDALLPAWEQWQKRSAEFMAVLHGDQNVLSQILWPEHVNLMPDKWASSYKYGGNGVIRVFHGNPKPHQIGEQWLLECWR